MMIDKESILKRMKRVCFCAGLMMLAGGCQFSPQGPFWPNSLKQKAEPELPDRITPFWTDTVLHQPKQPGVRGFGGRVYFYRDGSQDPIEVDGGLVVYAFDNEAPINEANKPIKKFVFTADQFTTHMSRTAMGPSYSIWLPWDEVGGETKQLSLVARFEGRDGGIVISDPTVKLLPGVNKEALTTDAEQGGVRAASFVSGVAGNNASLDASRFAGGQSKDVRPISDSGVSSRAMTIDLPPSFQRHLSSENDRNRIDVRAPLQSSVSARNEGKQSPRHDRPLSGETGDSTKGVDDQTSNIRSSGTGSSNVLPPGLRNTFRRSAKEIAGGSIKEQRPNSRPANWLVAPR